MKAEEAQQITKIPGELFSYISVLPPETFHANPDLDISRPHLEITGWRWIFLPDTDWGVQGLLARPCTTSFFPEFRHWVSAQQKDDLAAIESFFHGKSSGVDALTCHAGHHSISKKETIERRDFDPSKIPGGIVFSCLIPVKGSIQVPW